MASTPSPPAGVMRQRFVIRYLSRHSIEGRTLSDGMVEQQRDSLEEIRDLAMNLVRDGEASPDGIDIYERTAYRVTLSCDPTEPLPARR